MARTQPALQVMRTHAAAGQLVPPGKPRWAALIPTPTPIITRPTQTPEASAPAPSASAGTPTTSHNVTPSFYGTATPPPLLGKATKEPNSEPPPQATPYVWTGTSPDHAAPTPTSPGTGAPVAETVTTEPRPAGSPSQRFKTSTPYHAHTWLALLESNNLLSKYRHIPISLQYGFNAAVKYIDRTFTPPNDESISVYHDVFQQTIEHEFNMNRYEGPYTQQQVENIIGPFQTSPLSIVPKPNKPGKYRIIQNFSSPYTSNEGLRAINADIVSSDFPCTWGTFETICSTILHLPRGAQAAVRDVAEAYRTIPIKPSQWPGTVVRISESQFAIDKCLAFGCSSSAGVYGNLADASMDIFRSEGIGPISKWVDDFVFFRIPSAQVAPYNQLRRKNHSTITLNGNMQRDGGRLWFKGAEWPDGSFEEFDDSCQHPIRALSASNQGPTPDDLFTYSLEHVDAISEKLGIPWQRSKDQPFGTSFTYLGFLWDLDNKQVSLTEHKQAKYCRAIEDWNRSARHTLEQTEKLHGKLLHATHIIPKGRAYLSGLERLMVTQRDKPHAALKPPRGTSFELDWWLHILSAPSPLRPIPAPVQVIDVDAFSDASSGTGLAVLVGQKWKAWRLLPGWQSDGRDIAWAESVALELMAHAIVAEHGRTKTFRLHCDNRVVVEGWHNGRSRNRHVNLTFRRLHDLSNETDCRFLTRYVPSALNPADGPSRGRFPPYPPSFTTTQPDHSIANFLIDATLPHTQQEILASRTGTDFEPLRATRPSAQAQRRAHDLSEQERRGANHLGQSIPHSDR